MTGTAPDLCLPREDGKLVRLRDFVGHPVWVSFLSHAA
jgi:peroxiredoxin